jgi:FixJ family two-component response regulator
MRTERPIILVVDDDPAVRDSLKFSLELEGLVVHTFDSGTALLEDPQLAQARCLVLDYKMPKMDGFDVLDALEKRGIRVPVILIAGPVTAGIRVRALRAGVAHILEKPLLDTALVDRIRDVIGWTAKGSNGP